MCTLYGLNLAFYLLLFLCTHYSVLTYFVLYQTDRIQNTEYILPWVVVQIIVIIPQLVFPSTLVFPHGKRLLQSMALEYSAVQFNALQCTALQCNALMQSSLVHFRSVNLIKVQFTSVHLGSAQFSILRPLPNL